MSNGFIDLIELLKNEEKWEEFGREIALITPGKWDRFIQWAQTKGFDFDLACIQSYFEERPEILQKLAAHNRYGQWTLASPQLV